MREIKFRAWHTKEKCWHYFTLSMLVTGQASQDFLRYQHWCEWTGLFDKNGKGVYEGDIWQRDQYRYQIKWKETQFVGELDTGSLVQLEAKYIVQGEVVGNIWQNPELMEKSR